MEPVYRNIGFCRDPTTLWGKMREGRWDWGGVHKNGQFVLGSPRRGGVLSVHAAGTAMHGGVEGEHGLRTDAHPERAPSFSWYATPAEARAEFDDRVEAFERHDGPLLLRIRLLEGG